MRFWEEGKGSLPVVSAFKSISGVHAGDGDGGSSCSGNFSRGDCGFLGVFGSSKNCRPTTSKVFVFKSGSDESCGIVSGGFDGGGGGSRGCIDFLGVEAGSKKGRSSSSAASTFKSVCGGNLSGDGGGSDGGFHFSCGEGGLESSGSGKAVGIYFPTWEKPSLNRVEELNTERKADKLNKSPKTLMLANIPTILGTEPLVLLRLLRDILGACLQIGMVESLGKKMQWRACQRRKESSVLMAKDYENSKAMQWDRMA